MKKETLLYAAHTDCLVLGIGLTEHAAVCDAAHHGSEDTDLLDIAPITRDAADYVQAGGDCRGVKLDERGVIIRHAITAPALYLSKGQK